MRFEFSDDAKKKLNKTSKSTQQDVAFYVLKIVGDRVTISKNGWYAVPNKELATAALELELRTETPPREPDTYVFCSDVRERRPAK